MSDEEVVDQKATLEVSCKPKCVRQLKEYQACTKRIEGDESGHKHCTGQYFDYWYCIDKCVNFQNQSLRLQYLFAMSDEEVVDPKATMEVTCKPKCVRQLKEYQACTRRIEGDESGSKHCTGQYFDYWQCIDKCVAPKLFEKLQ